MESSSFSLTANGASFKLIFMKFTEKQFQDIVEIHSISGHHVAMKE
jgi:hypothetical protein